MNNGDSTFDQEIKSQGVPFSMDDTYEQEVILPNMIRLLDIKSGDRVLDVDCGQGYFSKVFAERGAEVIGLSSSFQLIEMAKQKTGPREKYIVLPPNRLSGNISPETIDKAYIILGLEAISDIQEVISEVSKTLKLGGKFYIVIKHPSFRTSSITAWVMDEESGIKYRCVGEYLSESRIGLEKIIDNENVTNEYSYHRPLQLYFKALVKNKLAVTRLEEWNSHRKAMPGSHQKAEDKAIKEIPMFMMLECEKSIFK
ncbi:MAG: methyltransferase domain-containing protein [bacterium]